MECAPRLSLATRRAGCKTSAERRGGGGCTSRAFSTVWVTGCRATENASIPAFPRMRTVLKAEGTVPRARLRGRVSRAEALSQSRLRVAAQVLISRRRSTYFDAWKDRSVPVSRGSVPAPPVRARDGSLGTVPRAAPAQGAEPAVDVQLLNRGSVPSFSTHAGWRGTLRAHSFASAVRLMEVAFASPFNSTGAFHFDVPCLHTPPTPSRQ